MGDSDSVRFSDGEYIEGMTLTQHLNQMKLFSAIAAAAVIGGSFIAPNPAEAGVYYDLKNLTMTFVNDGSAMLVFTDGNVTSFKDHKPQTAFPISDEMKSDGVSGEGNKYLFLKLQSSHRNNLMGVHMQNIAEGNSWNGFFTQRGLVR